MEAGVPPRLCIVLAMQMHCTSRKNPADHREIKSRRWAVVDWWGKVQNELGEALLILPIAPSASMFLLFILYSI